MIKLRTANLRSPLAWLLAAGLLAGCGSAVKLDEPTIESRTPTVVGSAGAGNTASAGAAGGASGGAAQSQVATVNLPGTGAAGASGAAGAMARVVYFDYDSFVVKDEFRSVVDSHARLLAANRVKRVVIEGHTDERGGSEYNLALGQKRAEAVARSLALLGATEAQIEAVSFGKERPAVDGHDEASWARNRRAEVKDR